MTGVRYSKTAARPAELVLHNRCLDDGCLSLSEEAGICEAVVSLDAIHLQKAALVNCLLCL